MIRTTMENRFCVSLFWGKRKQFALPRLKAIRNQPKNQTKLNFNLECQSKIFRTYHVNFQIQTPSGTNEWFSNNEAKPKFICLSASNMDYCVCVKLYGV